MHKINENIIPLLEEQLAMEFNAAYAYKALASWANLHDLLGIEKFFKKHAEEEMEHANRLIRYFEEKKTPFKFPNIVVPQAVKYDTYKPVFKDILAIFRLALQQEVEVTAKVNTIVAASLKYEDFSTRQFMDFYIEEQREEEDLFDMIGDRIEVVIGEHPMCMYFIDKDIASFAE